MNFKYINYFYKIALWLIWVVTFSYESVDSVISYYVSLNFVHLLLLCVKQLNSAILSQMSGVPAFINSTHLYINIRICQKMTFLKNIPEHNFHPEHLFIYYIYNINNNICNNITIN